MIANTIINNAGALGQCNQTVIPPEVALFILFGSVIGALILRELINRDE